MATAVKSAVNGNEVLFEGKSQSLLDMLLAEGQQHLFSHWPPPGERDDDKRRFMDQVQHLDGSYNGGLKAYINNARRLLEESRLGVNPFEGYTPYVPSGVKLDYGGPEYRRLEELGVQAAGSAAFVLVAGGLGERLGYSGIKLALPTEFARGACFLQLYIESILSLQRRHPGSVLPLAIMTSDDTHSKTQQLLDTRNYFGMTPDQVTLVKQEKVGCLSDNDAHLALDPKDPYAIQTKPHGHGDVHSLLHSSGLVKKWRAAGMKWVAFFQDTNALVFRGLTAALGVSASNDYDMNSLAVPRKAKEAIGGLALLKKSDGSCMTVNVEYNQLDPLLRATVNPEGDVNDETGYSPFPGNINQLVLKLSSYDEQLDLTQGIIGEFVNPKYADASKSSFKSSTRLECMMQDYPKALPSDAKVGFTVINQVWAAYSPVKNSPADARAKTAGGNPSHSATTGELDIYEANCRMMAMCGATIGQPAPRTFNGLDVQLWPALVWSPLFVLTFADLEAKISASKVKLAAGSTLVIAADDVIIEGLELEGALVVRGAPGSKIVVKNAVVKNKGWAWWALEEDMGCSEEEYIRGFRVLRHATKIIDLTEPQQMVMEGDQ